MIQHEAKSSEQTDPRRALPTTSSCWMGFRIAPSNPSELIGWWFKHGGLGDRSNQPICLMGSVLKPMQNHGDQLVGWCNNWVHQKVNL